jgi:hypothetical protein
VSRLIAAGAGAAGLPSARLSPSQLGMAVRQEPVVQWSRLGPQVPEEQPAGPHAPSHRESSQQVQKAGPGDAPSQGNSGQTADSSTQSANAQQGGASGGASRLERVIIHPPDMRLPVAWQLAYRGIMRHLAEAAAAQAKSESGATEAKDMHVVLRFHSRSAQLLYFPVCVSHWYNHH